LVPQKSAPIFAPIRGQLYLKPLACRCASCAPWPGRHFCSGLHASAEESFANNALVHLDAEGWFLILAIQNRLQNSASFVVRACGEPMSITTSFERCRN
jgi:hypothetical protein